MKAEKRTRTVLGKSQSTGKPAELTGHKRAHWHKAVSETAQKPPRLQSEAGRKKICLTEGLG